MKSLVAGLFVAAAFAPALAWGCGVCIEDKVAATYDHAILSKAKAQKQVVVFGAIDGVGDVSRATTRIVTESSSVKGVQRGTTLTSISPAAFSFALDPRVQTPQAAIADLQRRVDVPGLTLAYIRVLP